MCFVIGKINLIIPYNFKLNLWAKIESYMGVKSRGDCKPFILPDGLDLKKPVNPLSSGY